MLVVELRICVVFFCVLCLFCLFAGVSASQKNYYRTCRGALRGLSWASQRGSCPARDLWLGPRENAPDGLEQGACRLVHRGRHRRAHGPHGIPDGVKQARVQLLEQGAGFLIRLELRSVLRAFEGGHGGRLVKTHLEVLDGPHLDGVAWQLHLRDVAAEFN